MQGKEYSSGFFKIHSTFKPFVQVRNQQPQGPREQSCLSLSLKYTVVFGCEVRPPWSQKCNSKQSLYSHCWVITALGAGSAPCRCRQKAHTTLKTHSVLWELNDASASCWLVHRGTLQAWLMYLNQKHLKNQERTGAEISARHIMCYRDAAVRLLFLFCAQKAKKNL